MQKIYKNHAKLYVIPVKPAGTGREAGAPAV